MKRFVRHSSIIKRAEEFKPFYYVTRDADQLIIGKDGTIDSENINDYKFTTEEEAKKVIKDAAKFNYEVLSHDNFDYDVTSPEDLEDEFEIKKIENEEQLKDFTKKYFWNK